MRAAGPTWWGESSADWCGVGETAAWAGREERCMRRDIKAVKWRWSGDGQAVCSICQCCHIKLHLEEKRYHKQAQPMGGRERGSVLRSSAS